jgi:methionyl-tRNA formyltransferase
MRLVFLGSGSFAIPSLDAVVRAGHEVAAVVAQPDKEKGRGRELAAPPLKTAALAHGLRVFQPRRIREPEAETALRDLEPEIGVVVAYGQILPRTVLDIPPRGLVNVHGSLLPRYRGAAPIQWAIARGEPTTGVTTMLIDEGLDSGPILLARSTPIGEDETAADLSPRLAQLGAELLIDTLNGLRDGSVVPRPQDPALATQAPILRKEDGRLRWERSADELAAHVRGFHPWPGTHTSLRGRGLKVLRARPIAPGGDGPPPGSVAAIERDGVLVACGAASALRLLFVQPESRKPMDAFSFATGARLQVGDRFDP